jgi:hypothetical protein
MSKKTKIPYENFPSFVLRSPLFPYEFIENIIGKPEITEQELTELYRMPQIREAIWLASPNLFSKMERWLANDLTDKKEVEKLHYALLRYIIRMSSRCTPFGLFAGFTLGSWTDEGKIELPAQKDYTRHTRLDMNYLCALAQDLAKHPQIKGKIKYFPNTSIYTAGPQLRYVEYRYRNARRSHHIVAVDHSDYLEQVLSAASGGAFLKDLAALLVNEEEGITLEEASEFINELIDSQLLVNELEPAITGPEFLDQILEVLERITGLDDVKELLVKTRSSLEEMDGSSVGSTLHFYERIAEDLKPLVTNFELKYLFQTDMVKPAATCTMGRHVVDDVLKGLEIMNRLTLKYPRTNITRFREAFYERYEEREVPLIKALDTEFGVGYRQDSDSGDVAPLVDDLALPSGGGDSTEIRWNQVQGFLFQKYREAVAKDQYEVEFTDKDLEPFEADWDDLPDTFSSMVCVLDEKDEATGRAKVVMSSAGGASAANLLGRFCHADKETNDFVLTVTGTEEENNPDAVYAEIIHLPESRVGNILLRPVLRDYEIPYLAKAAVDREHQIPLQDLMVSVRANRIFLRSKRLNKEVRPRLSSAHNFSFNALPAYQFMCDLQTQGKRGGVGFNWGELSNDYPFLPRITYKNIIFSLARWNIRIDEVKDLMKVKDDAQLLEKMKEWLGKRTMPALVGLLDGDNELLINLDNALCVRTLFSVVKQRNGFQLVEFLFDKDRAPVRNGEGSFTNEFIFSFFKQPANKEKGN